MLAIARCPRRVSLRHILNLVHFAIIIPVPLLSFRIELCLLSTGLVLLSGSSSCP